MEHGIIRNVFTVKLGGHYVDYVNEIGKSLEKFLEEFKTNDYIYPEQRLEDSLEFTQDMFFALEKRGFITCYGKEINCRDDIELSDKFRITIEGINYLELRSRWWETFLMRTFYIPLFVAAITGLVAAIFKDTFIYYFIGALSDMVRH